MPFSLKNGKFKIGRIRLNFSRNSWFRRFFNSRLSLNQKPITNSGEKCLIIVSAKIDEHLCKSYEKCEQNNGSWAKVHKIQTSVIRRKK